ncbi:4-phosphoerythronate dehydrogenase [Legionella brunensis]|uniref:Erythronate-4-phosphate dehydrogenase n=1 Tax=Legionella brunensis TaxID=29422 RepID=A0A0W0SL68_9GAMM|nr:4-phosphoerythronate dehydrogenase [Legionella brunensis]KTC84167.1 erythronate-4-phosphate dehydrogenase [Legionella brunensis]
MKILADATLPGLLTAFPNPFELTLYHNVKELPALLKDQQILLCRSTLRVTETLLKNSSLIYVATASSGTDHIDEHYLETRGIKLIDAKGSNATAVADYVIASLAFLKRHKGFQGTKAAVIGIGEVGEKVVKRLKAVGMQVLCYDPPKAERDSRFISCPIEAVMTCDLISIHANLHTIPPYPSLNLMNNKVLKQLKPYCAIINASRGGIVNESDLFRLNLPLLYCTDVFSSEPSVSRETVSYASLCTPHIAGHSIEAKYEAVRMISRKLHSAYKLPHAETILPMANNAPLFNCEQTWEEYVLSLYNPAHETILLKSATNLEIAFLNLRKAHQNRHDFNFYAKTLNVDNNLLHILGL